MKKNTFFPITPNLKSPLSIIFFLILVSLVVGSIITFSEYTQYQDVSEIELLNNDEVQTMTSEIPANWQRVTSQVHEISFQYPESIDGVFANLSSLDKTVGSSLHPTSKSIWIYYSYEDAIPGDYGYILSIFDNPQNLTISEWWNSTFLDRQVIMISNRSVDDYQLNFFTLNDEEIIYFSNAKVFHRGYIKKVGNRIVILELNNLIAGSGPTLTEEVTLPLLTSITDSEK